MPRVDFVPHYRDSETLAISGQQRGLKCGLVA